MDSTRQPDITRSKILDAAFAEMYRYGFQAASIANILVSTGLTKGALYHHIPTKQALGLAVVDEVVHGRLEQRLFRPLRESERPVQALLDILEGFSARAAELVPLGCPLNNLMQEMSPLDPDFKEHLGTIVNTWRHAVQSALERGKEQGEVDAAVDCEAAALFIVSAWEGCIGIAKNLQSLDALTTCGRQLQVYIRGLRSA